MPPSKVVHWNESPGNEEPLSGEVLRPLRAISKDEADVNFHLKELHIQAHSPVLHRCAGLLKATTLSEVVEKQSTSTGRRAFVVQKNPSHPEKGRMSPSVLAGQHENVVIAK